MREDGGTDARFASHKLPDVGKVHALKPDHPALVEGRTLFPSRVAPPDAAPRMLISGYNSAKIGKIVRKGAWIYQPIFTLTLEERATCPRSCDMWSRCYGAGMAYPHRWDAKHPDFLDTLRAEIMTVARANPKGVVFRLHVLGDFFSLAYVRMWAEMLDRFPQIHVFGYTHRREDADDEESREIARALAMMANHAWDAFAVRLSHTEPGPGRAVVYETPPEGDDAKGVIMCPQQVDKTATCGSCGLCWNPAFKDKAIGFMLHGPVTKPRGPDKQPRRTRFTPSGLSETPAQASNFVFGVCHWPDGCGERSLFRKAYCQHHHDISTGKKSALIDAGL